MVRYGGPIFGFLSRNTNLNTPRINKYSGSTIKNKVELKKQLSCTFEYFGVIEVHLQLNQKVEMIFLEKLFCNLYVKLSYAIFEYKPMTF